MTPSCPDQVSPGRAPPGLRRLRICPRHHHRHQSGASGRCLSGLRADRDREPTRPCRVVPATRHGSRGLRAVAPWARLVRALRGLAGGFGGRSLPVRPVPAERSRGERGGAAPDFPEFRRQRWPVPKPHPDSVPGVPAPTRSGANRNPPVRPEKIQPRAGFPARCRPSWVSRARTGRGPSPGPRRRRNR